ncbi:MAG: transposase [Chloroflexi bacterium]|nr:transposase [Chloroflexota bacterium]
MLVFEYKVDGSKKQYAAIEEAIRTAQFIRNKCLRLWMDNPGQKLGEYDLHKYSAVLSKEFPFARKLGAKARQASASRAWSAIKRFYDNCKQKKPGKKGYPRFQHNNRSVEYKDESWKLEPDGRHITFTDGCGIGRLKLVGNPNQRIQEFPIQQIKRVRIVRRADGYYVQFCVDTERRVEHVSSGKQLGIDVGLKAYLTDSEGQTVQNPRHYRKAEKKLARLQRRFSCKQKKSANRKKAQKRLAKQHLKVQRQREDFARKVANAYVSSCDLIAYEDLQIRNMVRNRKLAKSIHDAGWGIFLQWVKRYAFLHNIPVIAVPPQYTSQKCSDCGTIVKKSLSIRTHICTGCGVVLDRDHNAALNILHEALLSFNGTEGHSGTSEQDSQNASGDLTSAASSQRRRGKSGR